MNKKATTLAVLRILEETDENNHLTRKEIEKKLKDIYNITIDRRTLGSYIDILEEFDYEIARPSQKSSKTDSGYYLINRGFEESEIKLLCNAIHSSRFIPINYSKDLVKKLLATQSKGFRKEYNDEIFVDNGNKKENKDFFLNIDIVSDAIKNRSNISFDYMKYDTNFKLVKREGDRREMSPHHLIYANEKIYVTGYSPVFNKVTHFRLDKMMNIKEENSKYVPESKKSDPYQYARTKLYMYSGDDITVIIRFKESVLDDMIDCFGKGINIIKDGDNYYKTTIKTTEQGIIYFALQYIDNIEVIEPEDIRIKIKESLSKGLKLYK